MLHECRAEDTVIVGALITLVLEFQNQRTFDRTTRAAQDDPDAAEGDADDDVEDDDADELALIVAELKGLAEKAAELATA